MNIALPTVILFLLLLPGFILQAEFRRPERTVLDTLPFSRSITNAILLAFVLNGLGSVSVEIFTPWIVRVDDLLLLMSGDRAVGYADAVTRVASHRNAIAAYFVILYFAAFLVGRALRGAITHFRLDRDGTILSRWFRFDTPWYYLLNGYDADTPPDGVLVAAVVEVGGSAQLYLGRLVEFFLNPDGSIDRLVLEDVSRREISQDASETLDQKNRFYPIRGDYFVIWASEMRTLNVHYLRLEEVS